MVSTPGSDLGPYCCVACDVLSPLRHPCSPVRTSLTSSRQEMKLSLHFVRTFICATTPNLSTVTPVKALDNVATKSEQMVRPIIIQPTASSRAITDFGVLSPYLQEKMHSKVKTFELSTEKMVLLSSLVILNIVIRVTKNRLKKEDSLSFFRNYLDLLFLVYRRSIIY